MWTNILLIGGSILGVFLIAWGLREKENRKKKKQETETRVLLRTLNKPIKYSKKCSIDKVPYGCNWWINSPDGCTQCQFYK